MNHNNHVVPKIKSKNNKKKTREKRKDKEDKNNKIDEEPTNDDSLDFIFFVTDGAYTVSIHITMCNSYNI